MDILVCNSVAIDTLQLFEINRRFPPVGGALSVEDERRLGYSGHVSVNWLTEGELKDFRQRMQPEASGNAHAV